MSTKKSFKKSKQFGDKLEFEISPAVIKERHPNCTIESPEDTGIYRVLGQAIPDHTIINQDGKTIAMYESKNKHSMYYNDIFSCDEKVFEYRTTSKKHNVDCYLIFYCEAYDKNNVYIVNVNVEPDFKREVNNEHGKWMYGYGVHLTKKHPIPKLFTKHDVNITDDDIKTVWAAETLDEVKGLGKTLIVNCGERYSNHPMKPEKINYHLRKIEGFKTIKQTQDLLNNLWFKGKKMGMNDRNYNNIINWA
jgi:hypothetical protein